MYDVSREVRFDDKVFEDAGKTYVEFYRRPIQNEEETLKQGRPVFEMQEFVKIVTPADKTNMIDRKVSDKERNMFPRVYEAFKADKSQDEASGLLLSAWGGVPPERVEEYAYHKVKTVEQLAGVSDASLQRLGPGALKDRERAKDYVEHAKGNAPLLQLRKQLEDRDNEMETMKRQVKEQSEMLAKLMAAQGAANDNREVFPLAANDNKETPAPTKRAGK
jgi:hypothetical protein